MEHILILTETPGFLINSLKELLESQGCRVTVIDADVAKMNKLAHRVGAVLIYGGEELTDSEKQQALIYLRDRAVEEDTAVFLAGNEDEVDEISKIIPKTMVRGVFHRPLNVKVVAQELGDYVRELHSTHRKKILVVDDSGAMLRNVKGWLEEKYQVILANSGAMAIKYLALNRPDLILLDYEMPIIDGRQVLEMIRSELDFSDVPVIFLTGKDDRESVLSVMEMKPEGYLLKSLRPEQIVQAVDNFFAHKKWSDMVDGE